MKLRSFRRRGGPTYIVLESSVISIVPETRVVQLVFGAVNEKRISRAAPEALFVIHGSGVTRLPFTGRMPKRVTALGASMLVLPLAYAVRRIGRDG